MYQHKLNNVIATVKTFCTYQLEEYYNKTEGLQLPEAYPVIIVTVGQLRNDPSLQELFRYYQKMG